METQRETIHLSRPELSYAIECRIERLVVRNREGRSRTVAELITAVGGGLRFRRLTQDSFEELRSRLVYAPVPRRSLTSVRLHSTARADQGAGTPQTANPKLPIDD